MKIMGGAGNKWEKEERNSSVGKTRLVDVRSHGDIIELLVFSCHLDFYFLWIWFCT